MNWKGKIIGGLIGFFIYGPVGLIIGLLIGHLFDAGYFNQFFSSFGMQSDASNVQHIFFDTTFKIMGYVAKSDGRVSEREIQAARSVMAQMNLSADMKQEAIRCFTEGKQPDFDFDGTIHQLKKACWRHPSLLRTFLEIQVQMAFVDGQDNPQRRAALKRICASLGIPAFYFDQFESQFRAGQNYQRYQQQGRAQQSPRQHLSDAYKILGVSSSATDSDIKKAYRRQMSKHHPDKLIAKGVPPEMVKLATQKTQQIQDAYEAIKAARGL
jgi:DnaJ like chaperone protein